MPQESVQNVPEQIEERATEPEQEQLQQQPEPIPVPVMATVPESVPTLVNPEAPIPPLQVSHDAEMPLDDSTPMEQEPKLQETVIQPTVITQPPVSDYVPAPMKEEDSRKKKRVCIIYIVPIVDVKENCSL